MPLERRADGSYAYSLPHNMKPAPGTYGDNVFQKGPRGAAKTTRRNGREEEKPDPVDTTSRINRVDHNSTAGPALGKEITKNMHKGKSV